MVEDPPPEIVRFLDRTVDRRPSAVIGAAVIEDNEIAWTAAAGGGDTALFQAGSLSKTVTAAVALELVERGDLDLDAEARGTTLRNLLGHTAGANVPFYPGYPQEESAPTLAQSLEGAEPATTPAVVLGPRSAGRFCYSGGGYALVQRLIEDATGAPFADTARRVIFEPLGMERSTFSQPPPEPLRAAAAWPDWRIYPECGAAGLWTTPVDLARFVSALLTQEAREQMIALHVKLPFRGQWTVLALLGLGFPRHAGLGLFVRGPRFINLGGAAGSFSALTGSKDDGTGAVVMTAGCRSPLAVRVLLELGDACGWTDLRATRRGIRRRTSDLLLRALS